ncbi:hypothetical protein [Actinoplanes sp. NPDC049118]|uniref:hypothetical protein n=1 Tax=Actinoplanes sp. NPDC049118 TaxID=3155769 RepID=UPI0033C5CE0D
MATLAAGGVLGTARRGRGHTGPQPARRLRVHDDGRHRLQHPTTAAKVLTVLALLAPTAGFAFRSPLVWVAVPTLVWRFTGGNPAYWGTGYH